MSDTAVRVLFERILGDDPQYDMPVEDDVARGRSLRARLRQRRSSMIMFFIMKANGLYTPLRFHDHGG